MLITSIILWTKTNPALVVGCSLAIAYRVHACVIILHHNQQQDTFFKRNYSFYLWWRQVLRQKTHMLLFVLWPSKKWEETLTQTMKKMLIILWNSSCEQIALYETKKINVRSKLSKLCVNMSMSPLSLRWTVTVSLWATRGAFRQSESGFSQICVSWITTVGQTALWSSTTASK